MSTISLIPPPTTVPDFPVRRFTVDEYHRLGETGILSEDDNVELIEGWIVPKMNRTPPHDVAVTLTRAALERILPDGFHVRVQSAVTTADSEPEPDVAIVRGEIRDYSDHHPGTGEVVLAVEVAETSLLRDRRKSRLYARAAFPQYWIVNLVDRRLEVYSQPRSDGDEPEYVEQSILTAEAGVTLNIDGDEIGCVAVRDLLP